MFWIPKSCALNDLRCQSYKGELFYFIINGLVFIVIWEGLTRFFDKIFWFKRVRTLSFLILPLIIKREYYSEKGGHLFRVSHFVIQNIFLIFSAQCLYVNVFIKFSVLSLMVLRTSYHSKLVTLITILETNLPKFLFKSFYCKYLVVFKLKQLTITLNIFKVVNVVIKVTYLNYLPIYHHNF